MRQISHGREYFLLYLLLKVIVQEADLLSSWLFHTKTWLVDQQVLCVELREQRCFDFTGKQQWNLKEKKMLKDLDKP